MLGFASSVVALLGSIPTCELTFKSNTMIDVIITEFEMELSFPTKIPTIPKKGDKIGAFFNGVFYVCIIHSFLYDFKQNGDFHRVEINVLAQ